MRGGLVFLYGPSLKLYKIQLQNNVKRVRTVVVCCPVSCEADNSVFNVHVRDTLMEKCETIVC